MKKQIAALTMALVMAMGGAALSACKPYTAWETVTEPGCVTRGLRQRTNKKTGNVEQEPIPALGHTYGENNKCTRCDKEIVPSEQLAYYETDGGYSVALGLCKSKEIVVPAYHEGVKVVSVRADGFRFLPREIGDTENTVSDITSVWLPDGIEVIEPRAFSGCDRLTTVTLPSTLTALSDSAFESCAALSSILVEAGEDSLTLTKIGMRAFYDCDSLTKAFLPDSVTEVGVYAFAECGRLTDVIMGAKLKTLDIAAFLGCVSLTGITLGTGVETISDSAFEDCNALREIILYGDLKKIGSDVFEGCGRLQRIRYSGTKEEWNAIDKAFGWDGPYDEVGDYIIVCTNGEIKKLVVPDYENGEN